MKHTGATTLQLVDFITRHMYKGQERKVEKFIKQALEYNTGDYGLDDSNDVVYVFRFDIEDKTAHILDLIIRDDWRNKLSLIKYITARNWTKFPYVTSFTFDRIVKYPYRNKRTYSLVRLFNKENKDGIKNADSTAITTSTAICG